MLGLMDETRRVVEPETRPAPRGERLDQYVGPPDQVLQDGVTLGRAEVERDAALACAHVEQQPRGLRTRDVVDERRHGARHVGHLGRLDAHDRGARVGHCPGRLGTGHRPCQVQDLEPLQRQRPVGPGGARGRRRGARRSGEHIIGVLTEARRPTEADHGACRSPCEWTGVAHRAIREHWVVDVVPEVPYGELRAVDDLVGPGHRRDQQDLRTRRLEQLRLGLGQTELLDHLLEPLVLRDRLSPVVEHRGVRDPVLVARRVVAVALLVDPVHQAAGERSHRVPEQVGDADEAVLARPPQLDVQASRPHSSARALDGRRSQWRCQHTALRRLQDRALRGDVDVLAEAAGGPLAEGQESAGGGVGRSVQERLRDAGTDRRAVGVSRHRQLAPGGQHRQIGRRPVSLGTGRAERADRHGHQRRVRLPQRGQVDGHCTRLQHHVGVASEAEQLGAPRIAAEIDDDAALAPIPAVEHQGPLGVLDPTSERWAPARTGTVGRLDEDDVGAQAGQRVAGQLPSLVGQIEHTVRREHVEFPLEVGRPDDPPRGRTHVPVTRSTLVPPTDSSRRSHIRHGRRGALWVERGRSGDGGLRPACSPGPRHRGQSSSGSTSLADADRCGRPGGHHSAGRELGGATPRRTRATARPRPTVSRCRTSASSMTCSPHADSQSVGFRTASRRTRRRDVYFALPAEMGCQSNWCLVG